jgi:hypothetical protein
MVRHHKYKKYKKNNVKKNNVKINKNENNNKNIPCFSLFLLTPNQVIF